MVACVVFPVLYSCGCSKTPETLFPVSGTVSVGGKPLSGGTVKFEMSEKGVSGKVYTSTGSVDDAGHYDLKTFGEAGAPAGTHRVWVVPNFARMPDEIGLGAGRLSPIPEKYMKPTTTELTYEVKAEDNSIDIEVPAK
jgi:hypothetical protein